MFNARVIFIIVVSFVSCSIFGMTFDNRYFPLLDKPILRHDDVRFFLRFQPFVMFADEAFFSDEDDEEGAGLFDMEGKFSQDRMDKALRAVKAPSKVLMRPDLALDLNRLSWSLPGRLDAAGVALRWYYALNPHWEIGGSWLVMGARSRLDTVLRNGNMTLTEGDKRDIQASHELSALFNNVKSFIWSQVGVGDLDLYLRLGALKHYFLRCKTVDAGIKLGLIAPLAPKRDIFNPASVPFGGNGHWGMYIDGAVDTELKDDLFAGFNIRFIQRFARTQSLRLPLKDMVLEREKSDPTKKSDKDKEDKDAIIVPVGLPSLFAPAIGRVSVQPGFTFVFAPYLGMGGLRDGFGAKLQYTLIMHAHDTLSDRRPKPADPLDMDFFHHRSSWAREYITFSILYDFAQDKECRGRAPLLSLDIDYPVGFFASRQSFKTVGISLRIESDLW